MALMRSPDGSETVDVADADVGHYQGLGATLVQPLAAQGTAASRVAPGAAAGPPTRVPLGQDIAGLLRLAVSPSSLEQHPEIFPMGTGAATAGQVGRVGASILGGAGRLAEKVASAPIIGRLPGARMVRGMAQDVSGMASRALGPAVIAAPTVAEAAAPAAAITEAATAERAAAGGKVAGRIVPKGRTTTAASRVAVKARAAAKEAAKAEAGPTVVTAKGTAASRVTPEVRVPEGQTPSRHNVQYYSESQGKFLNIEDMHISQLRNAMNKLGGRVAALKGKKAEVTRAVLDAMKDEVKHRYTEAGGLTIPGPTTAARVASGGVRGKHALAIVAHAGPEVLKEPGASHLEALLHGSIEAEHAMGNAGFTEQQRFIGRKLLARGIPLEQIIGGAP